MSFSSTPLPATWPRRVAATALIVVLSGCSKSSPTGTTTQGNATTIAVSAGAAQTATVGTAVTIKPAVKVTDAQGNGVSGVHVTFAVASGGGTITGGSQTTNSLGIATVGSWTLGTTAGANSLTATATGLVGSPVTFFATALGSGAGLQVQSIYAGLSSSCAISTVGAAYCWGSTLIPTLVSAQIAFTTLTMGQSHICGLTASGLAYCWGNNSNGELGDGTTTQRQTPTLVVGGHVFQSIHAGSGFTCGLTTAGAAYCWGVDSYGQLGDHGSGALFSSKSTPTAVTGGYTFRAIAVGLASACGITTTAGTVCWGQNLYGELGTGTVDVSAIGHDTPVAVTGGQTFQTLFAGWSHTCGLTSTGQAYCWGENNSGELGDAVQKHPTPVAVGGALRFASLAVGHWHICGVTASAVGYCWGSNAIYQLGDGTLTSRTTPAVMSGGLTWRQIAAGYSHTCGVTPGNAAYCWGLNNGALGDGTTTTRTTPTPIHSP